MSIYELAQDTGLLDSGTGTPLILNLAPDDKKIIIYLKNNKTQKYANMPKSTPKGADINTGRV